MKYKIIGKTCRMHTHFFVQNEEGDIIESKKMPPVLGNFLWELFGGKLDKPQEGVIAFYDDGAK